MKVSVPGPRKLVLIESGVYPYAEIDLEESVHLSGRNNAGKTSLLNALQFLYIDDINYMHFPTNNFQGKTKPFYFKAHGKSTILIEAETKWGVRTVGFHGLGAAAGCDWQRFGFDGPYDKQDFIDPTSDRPRDWDEVKALLAVKNYVELTQTQLRASLRGSGEKHSFRLELVPGGGRYDTFIEVFRQLLTLRKSKPEDLKRLLISVVEADLVSGDERNRGVVSLPAVVGDDYTRALAASRRFERIRNAEKSCQGLFRDFDKLSFLRADLPTSVHAAFHEASSRLKDRREKVAEAQEEAEEAREKMDAVSAQKRSLDDTIAQLNRKIGAIEGQLTTMRDTKERLAEETKELLEHRLTSLREDAAQLRMDLSAFHGVADPSSVLRDRAQRHRQARQTNMDAAMRLREAEDSGTRASWMDLLSEYPDEERDPLLRLLNPAMLYLTEGPEGMEILDPAAVGRMISHVAGASKGGVFSGSGVRVNLEALPPPMPTMDDPIVREKEVLKYEDLAAEHDAEAKRLEELAENSRTRELLQKRLEDTEKQADELGRRVSLIANWEELVQDLPAKEIELAEAEEDHKRQVAARATADNEHERYQELAAGHQSRVRELGDEISVLQSVIRDQEQKSVVLGCYLNDEGIPAAPAMSDSGFRTIVQKTTDDWKESIRLDEEVARKLDEVESLLDGMIAGDPETKVGTLRDLIEGLPDQRAQVEAAWQHIAVTAKTSFSYLLTDFETLDTRVKKLNRLMGKFAVSNLSDIQLRLVPNAYKMNILREFTQEAGGLYGDASLAERAKEQLGEMIRQGQVFKLFDLFTVELEVFKDGEKETYSSLDAESTGTAVTLKVIFLAHLLRDLYHSRTDVRLLIFVDEVDTLDDVNQETIRECARELGFVMIMASPNPANAKRLYFLRPEGKVTYIYPEESLEVVFRDEPEELEGEGDASTEAVS